MSPALTHHVRAFCDGRLAGALAALGLGLEQVAWPNRPFHPKNGEMYLRPVLIANPSEPKSLGRKGFDALSGIYQIMIAAPLNQGAGPAETLAGPLLALFPGGDRFGGEGFDLIITAAWEGTAEAFDGRWCLPLSIVWKAYTQRAG